MFEFITRVFWKSHVRSLSLRRTSWTSRQIKFEPLEQRNLLALTAAWIAVPYDHDPAPPEPGNLNENIYTCAIYGDEVQSIYNEHKKFQEPCLYIQGNNEGQGETAEQDDFKVTFEDVSGTKYVRVKQNSGSGTYLDVKITGTSGSGVEATLVGRILIETWGLDDKVDLTDVTDANSFTGFISDFVDLDSLSPTVFSGDGNDTVLGSEAGDLVKSGRWLGENDIPDDNGDYVEGGKGGDLLEGKAGADTLHGNDGNDRIYGNFLPPFSGPVDGNDWLYGDDGNDTIGGQEGHDRIWGGAGDDKLGEQADPGTGQTSFELGQDTLEGGVGNDDLRGGSGDDHYVFGVGNLGTDELFEIDTPSLGGGDLADAIDFTPFARPVTVSLNLSAAPSNGLQSNVGGAVNTLNLRLLNAAGTQSDHAFEQVYAAVGTYADNITGNSRQNLLQGRAGNDTIVGITNTTGGDTIEGGDGVDTLYGDDTLQGGTNADVINGGGSGDSIFGGGGGDYIDGDGFSDPIDSTNNAASPTGQTLDRISGMIRSRKNSTTSGTGSHVFYFVEDEDPSPTVNSGAYLFANNDDGVSRGYYAITYGGNPATNVDWEDLAYYKEGTTDHVYIADIGDEQHARTEVAIYRVAEPTIPTTGTGQHGSLAADRLKLQFPGGEQNDAASMFVDPLTGDIYVISRDEQTQEAAYRIPAYLYKLTKPSATDWTSGATQTLTKVGEVNFSEGTPDTSPVAADVSDDGLTVVLKSRNQIQVYERQSIATSIGTMLTGGLTSITQVVNAKDSDVREAISFTSTRYGFTTASKHVDATAKKLQSYLGVLIGGADTINAGAGNDLVFGDTGNDSILGGFGDDTIFASGGDDTIRGGDGNDKIYGGANQDQIYGDAGNDSIYGEGSKDTLYGGSGNDYIDGGAQGDLAYGGTDTGENPDPDVAVNVEDWFEDGPDQ